MKNIKTISMTLIICMAVAMFSGCNKKKPEEVIAPPVTPVESAKAVKGDIKLTYAVSGQVKPSKEVSITPKIGGKAVEVRKEIGDRVAENEILFSVDKKDLQHQLEQASAQLESGSAAYNMAQYGKTRAEGSSKEQQLLQSETGLKQAEAALKQSEISKNSAVAEYDKNQKLFSAGALSQQELDNSKDRKEAAEVAYNNAKQNYNNAIENDKLLRNTILGENVKTAQYQADQSKASMAVPEAMRKAAAENLMETDVKSPINGIIASKNVEKGEMVSQQMPAYTIVDIDTVTVETQATEKIINQLRKGQEVSVKIKALNNKEFQGTIDALSPAVTQQSVGYPVKIAIKNSDHEIKPGMFAEIDFVTESKSNVLKIPMESVLTEKGTSIVYVLEGDIAKRREVKIGLKDGKNYEVLSGINEGELVITKGQHYIKNDEKVQPVGGAQ